MSTIWHRLSAFFQPVAIAKWLANVLPGLVTAALVMVLFYLLSRLLIKGFDLVNKRARVDATVASFVRTAIRYIVFIVALLTALSELGIDTKSLLTSMGIVGLTIGFAAKDTLSNVISGLFIFWDRPFVVGDLIEHAGYYGRVADITLRSTRVVTVDGKMLAIPNSNIVNSTVASYTNFPHLRLDIDITVGVAEDLDRAARVFFDLIEGDARYMAEPAPEVVLTAVNDYNLALQFRVWLDDEKRHIPERLALRRGLFEALRSAGVEMPYETLQLAPVEVRQVVQAGR